MKKLLSLFSVFGLIISASLLTVSCIIFISSGEREDNVDDEKEEEIPANNLQMDITLGEPSRLPENQDNFEWLSIDTENGAINFNYSNEWWETYTPNYIGGVDVLPNSWINGQIFISSNIAICFLGYEVDVTSGITLTPKYVGHWKEAITIRLVVVYNASSDSFRFSEVQVELEIFQI